MVKKATMTKRKYDKTHMKQYLLKYHLENDADIIAKLDGMESKQGYVRQLIRDDIARTCPGSVPVSLNGAAMEILAEKAKETGRSVPELIALIVNEQLLRT